MELVFNKVDILVSPHEVGLIGYNLARITGDSFTGVELMFTEAW